MSDDGNRARAGHPLAGHPLAGHPLADYRRVGCERGVMSGGL